MNCTKKTLFAIAALMATSVAVSACGNVCTHMDNDGNKICDLCGSSLETAASSESVTESATTGEVTETETSVIVAVSINVKDQYGNAIANASLQIQDGANQPVSTATTDADGNAALTLPEGTYSVIVENLPDMHLSGLHPLEVKSGMNSVSLEILNNTPNGSEEHPFFLNSEFATFTFSANETYHFSLFAGDRRSIFIANADVTLTLEGITYTPDADGLIQVPVIAENQQNHLSMSVSSKIAQDVVIGIVAELGSGDNPIVLESIGDPIVVDVPKDVIVHYTWTVRHDGRLQASTLDLSADISMTNRTTSVTTTYTNGAGQSDDLPVRVGDVVSISIGAANADRTADFTKVSFRLHDGSPENPFFLVDATSPAVSMLADETLYFRVLSGSHRYVLIRGMDGTLTMGETTYTPDAEMKLKVPLPAETTDKEIVFALKSHKEQSVSIEVMTEAAPEESETESGSDTQTETA